MTPTGRTDRRRAAGKAPNNPKGVTPKQIESSRV